MRFVCAVFVCAGMCWGTAFAQAPAKAGDDLNDLMAARAKAMVEAHRLQGEIRAAVTDPAYTSPDIERLRKRIEDLQVAIALTQNEIRSRVEAIPEVQAKVRKMEEANKSAAELNAKVEAREGAK